MVVFYLETSALVRRYKTEKGSDVIEELFSGRGRDEAFATSLFTVLEVVATATRLFRGNTLSESHYRALMSRFLWDVRELVILPVENELMLESIRVARGHYLKAGDAVQIAAALQLGSSVRGSEDVITVASDREVCLASQAIGLNFLNPESEDAFLRLSEPRK